MRIVPLAAGVALVSLLTIGGSAVTRPLKAEEEAQIKPVGKPVSCIPLNQIRETRVRGDQVIDFYGRNGKVYRNRLPYSCPRLGFEERFGYKTSLNQLCSTDIITVISSPEFSGGPSCGLGEFQEISGAPR
jgi:hypothetical protein